LNNTTTRFWLALSPEDSLRLLTLYLTAELGEDNIRSEQRSNAGYIQVQKLAGSKSVTGTFVIKGNDSLAEVGQSLVTMKRSKVSTPAVGTKADNRDPYCTGEVFGGALFGINVSSRTLSKEIETRSTIRRISRHYYTLYTRHTLPSHGLSLGIASDHWHVANLVSAQLVRVGRTTHHPGRSGIFPFIIFFGNVECRSGSKTNTCSS
jgi:hypothetical protein